MLRRFTLALLLAGTLPKPGAAQETPSPEALVADWVAAGPQSSFHPHRLLQGCPNLAPWQERGIQLLLASDLTPERTHDLALAWAGRLNQCRLAWLDQWYFDQVDAAMRRGESSSSMGKFWIALQEAESPRQREYLRRLMLDTSKPEGYRRAAGTALFVGLEPQERLSEYLAAFQTRRLPFEVHVAQTTILLQRDPEELLQGVGRLVRQNPALADQGAFTLIVESSDRYASASARRALGDALRGGLRSSGVSGRQRVRLDGAADMLMRQPQPVSKPRP